MRSHRILSRLGLGFAFTWTLVGLTRSNIARAQIDTQPAESAGAADSAADRYFFEAKSKAAQKQWVDALALLERAWELKPSHDIAGNLGQVALKLGRYKKAATFLERCLRLFPPTGNTEQRAQIQTLFETARAHVAQVRIRVEPQPGVLVVDRVTVLGPAAVPTEPVFVDPGTHIIQIRRDGRIVGECSFLALANAAHDVNVSPIEGLSRETHAGSALRADHTAKAENPSDRPVEMATSSTHDGFLGGRSSWPVVIGATVGVAGLVSAGLLIDAANGQVDTANRLTTVIGSGNCSPGTSHTAECGALHGANARADTRYNWGHAMLGVGGVSLLATLGYVFWPLSSSKPSSGLLDSGHSSFSLGYQTGGGRVEWGGHF